jgi:hypothetical protein
VLAWVLRQRFVDENALSVWNIEGLDAEFAKCIEQQRRPREQLFARHRETMNRFADNTVVATLVIAKVQPEEFSHVLQPQRGRWVAQVAQDFVHASVNLAPDVRLEDEVFHFLSESSSTTFR